MHKKFMKIVDGMTLTHVTADVYVCANEHKYFHDTRAGLVRIPSVTEILSAEKQMGFVRSDVMARAMRRGSDVHRACFLHQHGLLDSSGLTDDLRGYVQAFWRWEDEFKPTYHDQERPLYDYRLDVCGTADIIGEVEAGAAGEVLIDIKTGEPQDWHAEQLCAYAMMLWEAKWEVHALFNLYLRRVGKYTFRRVGCVEQLAAGAKWVDRANKFNAERGR